MIELGTLIAGPYAASLLAQTEEILAHLGDGTQGVAAFRRQGVV